MGLNSRDEIIVNPNNIKHFQMPNNIFRGTVNKLHRRGEKNSGTACNVKCSFCVSLMVHHHFFTDSITYLM